MPIELVPVTQMSHCIREPFRYVDPLFFFVIIIFASTKRFNNVAFIMSTERRNRPAR